jgi:hypothetical protein
MRTFQKLTNESILNAWKEIFPSSMMLCSKACLGDSYFFKGKLAANKQESANGILENDPLNYMFSIEEDGTYKEHICSIYVKPTKNLYLVYESENLRRKTIKNPTVDKIKKRFEQVKQLVVDNKDNFKDLCFDINNKV